MASGEDPRARLRRIHPEACGTPNGYQQISRARSDLRHLGVSEDELPEYDKACQDAWATYTTSRRDHGGALGLPPGPPAVRAEHGTVQRWRAHVKERRRLRAEGVEEQDLPPIDQLCRDAWRDYNAELRSRPSARKRRRRRAVQASRSAPQEAEAEHGTLEGLKMHRRERRRLRAKGVPDRDLPPICDLCQAEALRIKVISTSQKPNECGEIFGTFKEMACRRPAGHSGRHAVSDPSWQRKR